ncbi:MBL fold metallo-hydrolase [Mesobacterium pallidum]|uniref:MBL fold metallo-hydrolase n=1 Tax=Mesobacterium pallidum TaxID=2872037 RepID=UPI001EE3622C|nr:MBL fold metallo-hydrolase [Mesobacterium pallidum]
MPMHHQTSPSTGPGSLRVDCFYDAASGSGQYVAVDEATGQAALIDVVADFDTSAARVRYDSAQEILDFVNDKGWEVAWILDTHPHADHLMASAWLKQQTGAQTAIGARVPDIAVLWRNLYNLPDAFDVEGDFDRLFEDGDRFDLGETQLRVMLSPGHTLGSISYVAGDAAFVHDTFMAADVGTSRADFPGGSSAELYDSLQALLDLPDDTRLFHGHDYPPVGAREDPAFFATVAEQRETNPHLKGGRSKEDFCRIRDARDEKLSLPDRMLHALQVNLRGGRLPEPEEDGQSYFKIPANRF